MVMSNMSNDKQGSKCFNSIRSSVLTQSIIFGLDWARGRNRSHNHQDSEQFKPYPNTSPGCASIQDLDL
jgi:hypothetical protein